MKEVTASIITIGDELLIGQTIDTNSAWIGRELNRLGIWLTRRVAIGDEQEEILRTLEQESTVADVILITGGLGPTDDDVTKAALCVYFDSELVLNETVLAQVEKRTARYGVEKLERNTAQALVPDRCDPLFNELGTAPGMWFEKDGKVYVSMPGVPLEMKGILKTRVLPRLLRYFKCPAILHRTIITTGVPESLLAEKLQGLEHSLPPHIKLAYLPGNGVLKLRLTARGNTEQRVAHELDQYAGALENLIPDAIIATEDLSLETLAGRVLKDHHLSVSTAESCTGGYVGHLFTSVPGSSAYYRGSVVSYTNDLKQELLGVPRAMLDERGAVSKEVVEAMLTGVIKKLHTDVGIAISGIMGPGGGSKEKPSGTVWIAAGNESSLFTRKLQLRYDRLQNIQLTGNYALILLMEAVKNMNKS